MNLWKSITILLILLTSSASKSHAHGQLSQYLLPFYENASNFTLIPAYTGTFISAVPGLIIGGGGYVIGYTAGLPFDKEEDFSEAAFILSAGGITMLGGTVAGFPFFVLEKTFYDFPRYLLEPDEPDLFTPPSATLPRAFSD